MFVIQVQWSRVPENKASVWLGLQHWIPVFQAKHNMNKPYCLESILYSCKLYNFGEFS